MSAYSLDLREKIVESVKKGVPKAETARRFGVDRATVKRYCKLLDERGTLEPRKAPGKKPKLDEKARKLLLEDLRERPWATHSQSVEFLSSRHPQSHRASREGELRSSLLVQEQPLPRQDDRYRWWHRGLEQEAGRNRPAAARQELGGGQ